MIARIFLFVLASAIAGSLPSGAAERDWSGENVQCVVSGLGASGLSEGQGPFPDFSKETLIDQPQVRALAAALTAGQAERIRLMFRDRELHIGNLRAEADYVRAHEAIYFAFESKSGRAFAVDRCGDQADVGALVYIVFGDWLMSAYGERTSWGRFKSEGSRYFASDLVRAAVVMELTGVKYDFSSLSSAMGFQNQGPGHASRRSAASPMN